ncbi:tRNA m(1)G37 methyltransferase [Candidatus Magnetomoraceae bacterium gMMP-15]
MDFTVLTLFPEIFDFLFSHSIIKRAIERKKISVKAVNIRNFASGKHHVTDDKPYGGGSGMVMKPEPLAACIQDAEKKSPGSLIILLSPQGHILNQSLALKLSKQAGLILVCGHYEGIDERICHDFIDYELSIGDYVMTGGEPAAMVVIDAVSRLIPGVLGDPESAAKDSFSDGLLEHAHYTRPPEFGEMEVPGVLLSGHHKAIENWRRESSLIRTALKRPDLLFKQKLNNKDILILKKWAKEIEKIIKFQSAPGPDALSCD